MNIGQDITFAFRKLRKTPLHTLTTLVVLTMGLSLYIAAYSYARMQDDKPMPFLNGDKFVAVKAIDPLIGFDRWEGAFDFRTFERLQTRSDSFITLGAIQFKPATLSADDSYAQRFNAATLSVDLFNSTSINPILGRLFSDEDAEVNAANVTIISYRIWQDYFNGKGDIIGQTTRIDNKVYNIIGVMPERFQFPVDEYLWFPLRPAAISPSQQNQPVTLAGIIKSEADLNKASLALDNILEQLVDDYPDDYSLRTSLIVPYAQAEDSSVLSFSFITLIIAYGLLALTVVNLSSLLYMRAVSRQEELAVRASLGASGFELAKQVLIESFIVCFTGLVLSLSISVFMLKALQQVYWDEAFWYTFTIDSKTLVVTTICTLLIWLVSGLSVALRAWSTRPGKLLSQANRGTGDKQSARVTNVIVCVEVILSCLLLVTTGSAVFGTKMTTVNDFGIDSQYTAVARFDITPAMNISQGEAIAYVDNLIQEIKEISEVTDAGVSSRFPGWNGAEGVYQTPDTVGDIVGENLPPQSNIWVSNNYFEAIGIRLVEGRGFNGGDTDESFAVTIITQEFAQELWPGESAIGKQIISTIDNREKTLTVVGTIQPLVQASNTMNVFLMPTLYRPLAQGMPENLFLVFNTRPGVPLSNVEQSIRQAATTVNRNIALERFNMLDKAVHDNEGPAIFLIMESFALSTLVLAAIGVFAVLSRSIIQRTRDIGICRALGANHKSIFLKYSRQGLYFLLAGFLFGSLPAVLGISYFTFTRMEGTSTAIIPTVALFITVGMGLVIFIASLVPAKYALRLQPGDALRYE